MLLIRIWIADVLVGTILFDPLICQRLLVARTNASCRTYECVMSHVGMRHVTRTNVTCNLRLTNLRCHSMDKTYQQYEWALICQRLLVPYTNMSCHTYECVMSHTRMRHVTRANTSCHTHECVMSHVRTRHLTCGLQIWRVTQWTRLINDTNESGHANKCANEYD